jgi:hypothetical protein
MYKKNFRALVFPLLKRKRKYVAFFAAIASVFLIFFEDIDDQTAMELYLQKLQSLSVYYMDSTQKYLVTNYYLQNKNRHPNVRYRHKIRSEFNSQKKKIKQEWCAHYSLEWPMESYQTAVNNGSESAAVKAQAFQAHHIVPINSGGINQWWNISPISDENHKKLHASLEEHACFSHDFILRRASRFVLKINGILCELAEKIRGNEFRQPQDCR